MASPANTRGFAYVYRGEPVQGISGKSATTGLAYFYRGEPYQWIIGTTSVVFDPANGFPWHEPFMPPPLPPPAQRGHFAFQQIVTPPPPAPPIPFLSPIVPAARFYPLVGPSVAYVILVTPKPPVPPAGGSPYTSVLLCPWTTEHIASAPWRSELVVKAPWAVERIVLASWSGQMPVRTHVDVPCGSAKILYHSQQTTGYDITGWTLQGQLKANKEDTVPLQTLTPGNGGITVLDAPSGLFYSTLTEAMTTLVPGTYWYAVGRTDTGSGEPLAEVEISIVPNVLVPFPDPDIGTPPEV